MGHQFYTMCTLIILFGASTAAAMAREAQCKAKADDWWWKTLATGSKSNAFLQKASDSIFDNDVEKLIAFEDSAGEYDKGTPGLDYLGVGYDSVFGNTLGSEDSLLDPGYRAPIINFQWRKNSQGYSPSLKAVYPLHGWVRPVYSCGRSSKIQEIENLDELKKAFSASASLKGDVPSASFSASAQYKKEAENIANKRERIYMHTDQCVRYQAGIPLNIPWDTTDDFKDAVKTLKKLHDGLDDECSVNDVKENTVKEKCLPLKNWMNFFQTFGTHYVHQLVLGGKLVQTMRFDAEALKELKQSGVNVDAAVSASLGSVQAGGSGKRVRGESKLDEVGSKTLTVIGGQMPSTPVTGKEFAMWGNSVADNPMPIGIAAESLKGLLHKKLHNSYTVALLKYAEMHGITYETLVKIGGSMGGLMREIKNGAIVSTVNWDVNGAECPVDKKVLIGFSLLFNPQGGFLGIIPCQRAAHKCAVPRNRNKIRSVSWVICTSGLQPNVAQVSDVNNQNDGEATVSCPPGTAIHFGMKVKAKEDRLISAKTCEKGKQKCHAVAGDKMTSGVWAVCSPESSIGGHVCYQMPCVDDGAQIAVVAEVSEARATVQCKDDERIIAGTKIRFMATKDEGSGVTRSMKIEQCERYLSECHVICENECLTSLVMAICASKPNDGDQAAT